MKISHKLILQSMIWALIVFCVFKFILYIFDTSVLLSDRKILGVIALTIWLLLALRIYIMRFVKVSNSIKQVLLWVFIFCILIIFYAFRFEFDGFKDRVLAVLIPSYSWTNDSGELVIARSQDGHFYIDVVSESGKKINFLIDTGASDVALTKDIASSLGIDVSGLKYTKKYITANGPVYAAPVRINELKIGGKIFYDVAAHVGSEKLGTPLLGMSVIGKFTEFSITKDLLILTY